MKVCICTYAYVPLGYFYLICAPHSQKENVDEKANILMSVFSFSDAARNLTAALRSWWHFKAPRIAAIGMISGVGPSLRPPRNADQKMKKGMRD